MTSPLPTDLSIVTPETEIGTADEVISEVDALVSPPSVCVKLYNQIHCSKASAKDIGETLEFDPNLVARVLKIANSAAYSFPSQISSVSKAVTIIGTEALCNLVMAIAAVRSFSKLNGGLCSIEDFWHHSVYVALCSRHLARECKLPDADSFFIAGLLHDVGIPILYGNRPGLSERIQPYFNQGEDHLVTQERTEFEFDHALIGAKLLSSWCLPPILIKAISAHHGPVDDPGSAILNISEHLAETKSLNIRLENALKNIDNDAWQHIGKKSTEINFQKITNVIDAEQESVLKALIK